MVVKIAEVPQDIISREIITCKFNKGHKVITFIIMYLIGICTQKLLNNLRKKLFLRMTRTTEVDETSDDALLVNSGPQPPTSYHTNVVT